MPLTRAKLVWGRRIAFLVAILGVWFLARGDVIGAPGVHDWKGAGYMTAFLLVVLVVIEIIDRPATPRGP